MGTDTLLPRERALWSKELVPACWGGQHTSKTAAGREEKESDIQKTKTEKGSSKRRNDGSAVRSQPLKDIRLICARRRGSDNTQGD